MEKKPEIKEETILWDWDYNYQEPVYWIYRNGKWERYLTNYKTDNRKVGNMELYKD